MFARRLHLLSRHFFFFEGRKELAVLLDYSLSHSCFQSGRPVSPPRASTVTGIPTHAVRSSFGLRLDRRVS